MSSDSDNSKSGKIKEYISIANKNIQFFKSMSVDELKKNAILTAKNKKLGKENTFLKEELNQADNIIDEQALKIKSLTDDTDVINESINSFGITNEEFDNLTQMRDKLFKECYEEEMKSGNGDFEQFVQMRKEKREQRRKMFC